MALRVIIRGHEFDYQDKAPFVVSGKSVLGAIEFDEDRNAVKCHECGEWFSCISHSHLSGKHGLSAREYKLKHGLNVTTGLCTPSFSDMRAKQNGMADQKTAAIATARLVAAGREYKRVHGNNATRGPQLERINEVRRCQAQTLFRIQVLAAELDRTPTDRELRKVGIDEPLMVRNFGSKENAFKEAGIEGRPTGKRSTDSNYGQLPKGFPTKEQLLNTRMPWPREYFTTEWGQGVEVSNTTILGHP